MSNNETDIEPGDARISVLIALLADEPWLTAKKIAAKQFARTSIIWTDRLIRSLAASTGGEVASSALGYRLTKHLSKEEMTHAQNRLLSQVTKMQQHARQIGEFWQSIRGENRPSAQPATADANV